MRTPIAILTATALIAAAIVPARALSTLIIIPTARTTGAHRYSEAFNYEGVIFGRGQVRRWVLKSKFGIGRRAEVGLNITSEPSTPALWQAKYTFAETNRGRDAFAVGFRSLGNNAPWAPYIVTSNKIGDADFHLGLARGTTTTSYFAGADGPLTPRWHWMADFINARGSIASTGIEYYFDPHWTLRFGHIERSHGEPDRNTVEVKFSSKY